MVETFAGDSYFPTLRVLDTDRINANHVRIAELAQEGVFDTIVTTNFDTLIERAFREQAVKLQVLVDEAGFRNPSESSHCLLLKVHGSVKASDSLVDTVSQKYRGLSASLRTLLEDRLRGRNVKVIGFSGADLEFDQDYLPFRAAFEGGHIQWVIRPGTRDDVPAPVRKLRELGDDRFELIEATLPEYLHRLGREGHTPTLFVAPPNGDAPRSMDRVIRSWLTEPHIGPGACAVFMAMAFRRCGQGGKATKIREAIREKLQDRTSYAVGDMILLRQMGLAASDQGNYEEACKWARLEILATQNVLKIIESPQAVAETEHNLSGAYNNLGRALLLNGEPAAAKEPLEVARALASKYDHPGRLATVLLNLATAAEALGDDPEAVLALLRPSLAFAEVAGHTAGTLDARLKQAHCLIDLAEYDAAIRVLDRARSIAKLSGHVLHGWTVDMVQAEVLARRSLVDEALRLYRTVFDAATAADNAAAANQILVRSIIDCAHDAGAWPTLRAMATVLADGGVLAHPHAVALIEQGSVPHPAARIKIESGDPQAAQCRLAIVHAEAQRQLERLPELFAYLTKTSRDLQVPERLEDLAFGLETAAKAAGDRPREIDGLNLQGVARDLLGDAPGAVAFYRSALAREPDPEVEAMIHGNIALVLSRGEATASEARSEFETALKGLVGSHSWDNATRVAMNFSRWLAQMGEREAAHRFATDAVRYSKNGSEMAQAVARQLAASFEDDAATPELPEEPLNDEDPATLANRGIRLTSAGSLDEATEFIRRAMQIYQDRGDKLGVARCFNNLSDIATAREDSAAAVALAEASLALRRELGDVTGQVLTLSKLCAAAFTAGQDDNCLRWGRECLLLSVGKPPDELILVAQTYLALCYARREELVEMRAALEKAESTLAWVPNAKIAALLKEVRIHLNSTSEPKTAPRPPSQRIDPVSEATRRIDRGLPLEALALLDEAEREVTDPLIRARIWGTRGHAWKRMDEHRKAVREYSRAFRAFSQQGEAGGATTALMNLAVSLRMLGREDASAYLLASLRESLDPGSDRASVTISLANSLWMGSKRKQGAIDQTVALECEALYDAALLEPKATYNGLTTALVARATFEEARSNFPAAIAFVKEALQHGRRANVFGLDLMESKLEEWEAMAHHLPG
ncbi:MAG: tetratricopeptide repeat protein [Fimbriimonas sp.]